MTMSPQFIWVYCECVDAKSLCDERCFLSKGEVMKGARLALMVASVLILIMAGVFLIFSILLFVGAGMINATSPEGWAVLALIGAVLLLVIGLFFVIVGILGIRGARNPEKTTPLIVFSVIGAILPAISLVLNALEGTLDTISLIGLVAMLICLVLALIIRRDTRSFS